MIKIYKKIWIMFLCVLALSILAINPIKVSAVEINSNIATKDSMLLKINKLKIPTIVIDPGHGGYDSGAVGPSGVKEKDIALAVSLKLQKKLQQQGYKVVLTRTSNKVPWPSNVHLDLKTRVQIANSFHTDYFISIHNNYSNLKSIGGTETYFAYGSNAGKVLANSIQNEIIKSIPLTNRGIKSANYYVIKHTNSAAVLTELAFISNPQEEKLLNNVTYQNKWADAIDLGIVKVIQNNV